MRKIFLASVIILFFISFIIISGCKKDSRQINEIKPTKTEHENVAARLAGIYVSEYDFLVFPSVEDLEDYKEYILTLTHAEAQEYLTTIEFYSSLGTILYDEEYADETVTEDQVVDYIFNTNKIFQIDNVIMKPITESECETTKWDFLLTVRDDYLNTSSHESLISGIYDEDVMNKFATAPQEQTVYLFDFINTTPYGYEETETNECPETTEQSRKFWGWTEWSCGPCDQTGHKYCYREYHAFWIKVKPDYGQQQC